MTTLGVEVGLEPMPRQRAKVGMGRRENKLRAPRELAGLPTQLLGSVSRSWKSWAHPAPLCSRPHHSPNGRRHKDSFSPMCSLLAGFRSQAGVFPTVHSVRSVRLKSGEEVLWASAGLVPRGAGGRTSWYFRDTSCKVDATTSLS